MNQAEKKITRFCVVILCLTPLWIVLVMVLKPKTPQLPAKTSEYSYQANENSVETPYESPHEVADRRNRRLKLAYDEVAPKLRDKGISVAAFDAANPHWFSVGVPQRLDEYDARLLAGTVYNDLGDSDFLVFVYDGSGHQVAHASSFGVEND